MSRFVRFICWIVFVASVLVNCGVCAAARKAKADRIPKMRMRAQNGDANQQLELAIAYLTGEGVEQDLAESAHWYEEAAKRGNPEAQNQIAYFYQKGIGVRRDETRAVHWYQLASASGLAWAKMNLGAAYLNGVGVRKNPPEGRQLFQEAAEKGLGRAAAYLGEMEYFGYGIPADKADGEKWLLAGRKMHDPVAAYYLAYLYSEVEGHVRDMKQAAELLRFAAGKGYMPAQHMLGRLVLNNPDLAATDTEARTLLEEASDAGNWKSTALLGIMERDGRGAAANPVRALFYFRLSTLQGGSAAERLLHPDLESLANKLPREEQTRAADEAQVWMQNHSAPIMFLSTQDDSRRFYFTPIWDAGSKASDGE